MQRDVAAYIVLSITEPAELVFSVAVSSEYEASESLRITLDGTDIDAEELLDLHGTRLHRVRTQPGELVLSYSATVEGTTRDNGTATIDEHSVDPIRYLRPSRYAESDSLAATAAAQFAGIHGGFALLTAVSSWVGTQLAYVPGSSLPTDGAIQTLLARRGVCRDYAHLCVALLRALGMPARLASVYAPGLNPMDFHAVAEALIDGTWRVVDATTLAPRETLVRIATGRDAADTAFLTVLSGRADLVTIAVTAVADRLPDDDIDRAVSIG